MRSRQPKKEFELVAACCRWPLTSAAKSAISVSAAGVDWPLFLKMARRHRVEALVENALRQAGVDAPSDVSASLRSAAMETVRQNVTLAAECVRLNRLFEGAGVPIIFVKGVTLGLLAYGTLSLKMGWDIDILVPEEQLDEAADLLIGAGYACTGPKSRESLLAWHRVSKESEWRHREHQAVVELHTRLVDNVALLPVVGSNSPRQHVSVSSGTSLPTLASDELFAYLCVHGASSAWFRIKWIADVAALLGAGGAQETERLYQRAHTMGAGRAPAQALLLCARLFGAELTPGLRRELNSDWRNRYLYKAALRLMSGRLAATELHDTTLGTLPIHLTQLFLRPGLRFKRSEVRRQMTSPDAAPLRSRLWRSLRKSPPAA
jgi:hypothetical protein